MCPIDPHDPALEQWLCGEECCLQTAAFEVYNTRGSWRVCATHLAPLLHEELETHPRSPWTFVTDPNGERHGRDHITMGTALAAAMQAALDEVGIVFLTSEQRDQLADRIALYLSVFEEN